MRISRTILYVLPSLLLLAVTACTPMMNNQQRAADASKEVIADTKKSWRDLFTYNPQKPIKSLPQTRYCYKTQSDVVCYDSAQPNMTAKLVGYQDGTNMSWVQPGGGSLGQSGGEPTAQANMNTVQVAPGVAGAGMGSAVVDTRQDTMYSAAPGSEFGVSSNMGISSSNLPPPGVSASSQECVGEGGPFYCKESPYVPPAEPAAPVVVH
jgi:hypothetical protein